MLLNCQIIPCFLLMKALFYGSVFITLYSSCLELKQFFQLQASLLHHPVQTPFFASAGESFTFTLCLPRKVFSQITDTKRERISLTKTSKGRGLSGNRGPSTSLFECRSTKHSWNLLRELGKQRVRASYPVIPAVFIWQSTGEAVTAGAPEYCQSMCTQRWCTGPIHTHTLIYGHAHEKE